VNTIQWKKDGEIQMFSVIPKTMAVTWFQMSIMNVIKIVIQNQSKIYPPKCNLPIDNPALWNEKHFSRNIWPKTSWMKYDVDIVINSNNDTLR
jgi:hypothetical protein